MATTWRARVGPVAGAATVTVGSEVVTGPALLEGAERWAAAFGAAGLVAGSRLVVVLPTGPCLAQVLLAGLWEGLTLVPLPPGSDPVDAADAADARAAVVGTADAGPGLGWAWLADGANGRGPQSRPEALRPAGDPTPLARVLCPVGGGGPWPALLDDNLEHAVGSVLAVLQPRQARWLSVLPWHAPTGLLLDLLPALQSGGSILRPGLDDQPSPGDVANAVERWQPTHTILPLALVRELDRLWDGLEPLECLVGGLASGPGLDPDLAIRLGRTRLRTHRGPAELSCMVTLGEPGVWRPGALGRAIGCSIAEGPGGTLLVSGRAVAGGRWHDGALEIVDRRSPVAVAFT